MRVGRCMFVSYVQCCTPYQTELNISPKKLFTMIEAKFAAVRIPTIHTDKYIYIL